MNKAREKKLLRIWVTHSFLFRSIKWRKDGRDYLTLPGKSSTTEIRELDRVTSKLRISGVVLLGSGAVTSFVPNPDHIHVTGVPQGRARTVSLHLYGRMMSSFNIYDVEAGTRRPVEMAHNES